MFFLDVTRVCSFVWFKRLDVHGTRGLFFCLIVYKVWHSQDKIEVCFLFACLKVVRAVTILAA